MSEGDSALRTIAVAGPTACGKTRRAVQIARALDGEIVSCDSRQVYTGMDIGTGKDLKEYGDTRVHLLDICKAGERYNLYRFLSDAHSVIEDLSERGRRVVLCGGSGMYIENLLAGITLPDVPCNPALRTKLSGLSLPELTSVLKEYKTLHNTTDVDTVQRAVRAIEIEEWYIGHPEQAQASRRGHVRPIDAVIIGLDISREDRRARIDNRLRERMEEGMVEEVRELLASGVDHETLMYYGLEYKFMSLYLQGRLSYEEMYTQLQTAIHQFAKRQMTWFRGMERRGFRIHWLPYNLPNEEFIASVKKLL